MSKRILITGASGGLGSAMAQALAEPGVALALHYRQNRAKAEALAQKLLPLCDGIELIQFDAAVPEEARAAVEKSVSEKGPFYGVIFNCGITDDAMFPNLESDAWTRVLRTNLESFHHVVQPTMMPMIRAGAGGRIIVISSISGVIGNSGQTNYSASKAGLIGVAKALAAEVAKRNITVNVIAPGLIDTEMTAGLDQKSLAKMIPMRRFGKAEEVGSLAKFLMSDGAGYISRQVIGINGGMV
jgi:3-oxoacyl-[acyl-carrier protein] reductase